tara:strand:- start:626 stop:1546 length:921 start_codon:yes stop_codon:yes gene_type:complete
MINKQIAKILVLSVIVGSFYSCQNSDSANITEEEVVQPDEVVVAEPVVDDGITYQVPTPNELFAVLKYANIKYDNSVVNDIANVNSYSTKSAKALNFGVYAADLAYASSLGSSNAASDYFETIKKLSADLGVENALDEAIMSRIQSNMEAANGDSLFYLSNETYYKAYSYLEQNDRSDVLGMIVMGGWVEGLNIMLNVAEFEEGSELSSRIADQKLTMSNLLVFASRLQNDDINDIVSEMSSIEDLLNSLEYVSSEDELSTTVESDHGEDVVVLGGGDVLTINAEQHAELKSLVSELRSSIIEGSL